jgi:hypothetical protein
VTYYVEASCEAILMESVAHPSVCECAVPSALGCAGIELRKAALDAHSTPQGGLGARLHSGRRRT